MEDLLAHHRIYELLDAAVLHVIDVGFDMYTKEKGNGIAAASLNAMASNSESDAAMLRHRAILQIRAFLQLKMAEEETRHSSHPYVVVVLPPTSSIPSSAAVVKGEEGDNEDNAAKRISYRGKDDIAERLAAILSQQIAHRTGAMIISPTPPLPATADLLPAAAAVSPSLPLSSAGLLSAESYREATLSPAMMYSVAKDAMRHVNEMRRSVAVHLLEEIKHEEAERAALAAGGVEQVSTEEEERCQTVAALMPIVIVAARWPRAVGDALEIEHLLGPPRRVVYLANNNDDEEHAELAAESVLPTSPSAAAPPAFDIPDFTDLTEAGLTNPHRERAAFLAYYAARQVLKEVDISSILASKEEEMGSWVEWAAELAEEIAQNLIAM